MNITLIQQWHDQLSSGEAIAVRVLPMAGVGEHPIFGPDAAAPGGQLVFPGAFNPLHAGHRGMADVAEEIAGRPAALEISIENVDKLSTDAETLVRRLEQFPPEVTVWLTRPARFTEKAAIFPAATFVVGVDTIERIGDARYYEQDESRLLAAIDEIAGHGCRFLVFGRAGKRGFTTLADLELPAPLLNLCEQVPESKFRQDVSSTELRIAGDD